ncbi:MAG: hypothetical protein EOM24_03350 [Chloroflexia bacterium]|nr:hypothetical protein [Chloroflexia bacterium]
MILQRLKHETQSYHDQMEVIVDLPARLRSREAYCAVLVRFYGFYAPVEAALDRLDGLAHVLPDITVRRKTPLIACDLAALGRSTHDLPWCAELPALPDVAHALGCLYVLEGATLGGQLIARQLAAGPGVTSDRGGAFFHSYGKETGSMWRSFGAGLAEYANTPEREATIIGAAQQTFRALEHWLAGKG